MRVEKPIGKIVNPVNSLCLKFLNWDPLSFLSGIPTLSRLIAEQKKLELS